MHRTEYIENDPFEQDRYNERMDFLESFCATLNENRPGPVADLGDEFDRGDAFYDLINAPCCEMFPDGRTHYRALKTAYRHEMGSDVAVNAVSSNRRSPSNSARGSPHAASPRPSSAFSFANLSELA
ncbi:MAG: hypothetical protein AB7J13_16565 [Pyrinomonadaceae bacterium]